MMRLTFLGTSAGVPTKTRNVTGLAVSGDGHWDLFDCGEATQHQLLGTPLSLARMDNVFISHLHGDHVFGLFGLLASRSMEGTTRPLSLFGPAGLDAMVRAVLDASATVLTYPLEIRELDESGGVVIDDSQRTVEAVPLSHRVTSFAWWIREPARPGLFDVAKAEALRVPEGPLYGRLQQGEAVVLDDGRRVQPDDVVGPVRAGRSLVVAGDNSDPDALIARIGGVQLLVHEATFTEAVLDGLDDDRGHSTAARVAAAAQTGGVPSLILTHFSPRFGADPEAPMSIETVRAEAAEHFRGTLHLAADLDEYELTVDGETELVEPG